MKSQGFRTLFFGVFKISKLYNMKSVGLCRDPKDHMHIRILRPIYRGIPEILCCRILTFMSFFGPYCRCPGLDGFQELTEAVRKRFKPHHGPCELQ